MQVLEILSPHEHRIVAHPGDTPPPAGLRPWGVECDAALPFARVWADVAVQAETVSEIVNGYCPPPAGQPMTVRPDLEPARAADATP